MSYFFTLYDYNLETNESLTLQGIAKVFSQESFHLDQGFCANIGVRILVFYFGKGDIIILLRFCVYFFSSVNAIWAYFRRIELVVVFL